MEGGMVSRNVRNIFARGSAARGNIIVPEKIGRIK